jgi:rhodanese-related sulfurtransferase
VAGAVGELEVEEFARWRSSGRSHVLIDVRTDDELAIARIDGAVHIPMHQFVQRIGEVPREEPIVVVCHVGERSYRVASFLIANGYTDVFNLEGGIDAYSERVDSSIPRY